MNLQKFTFHACVEPRSMKMFAPAQKIRSLRLVIDDGVHLGMLEAHALNRVGEFDVDREIVGVELQPVVGESPASSCTSIDSVAIEPSNVSFQWRYRSGEVSKEIRGLGVIAVSITPSVLAAHGSVKETVSVPVARFQFDVIEDWEPEAGN